MPHGKAKRDFTKGKPLRPVADTVLPNIPVRGKDWTVASEMLLQRIVRLDGEVNNESAAIVNASIRYLEKQDPEKPIHLVINSEGGYVTDGMSIVDTIRNCRCPIHTYTYGLAASMASVIFVVGNKRFMSPNAEIMIHQPLGGMEGQQTDIDIHAHDMRQTREKLTRIYAEETGLSHKDIDDLIERDYSLTAARAKQLGLVDEIMTQENYFRIIHNMDVPEYKKPRYPDSRRAQPRKSIEEHFNDIADRAAKRRRQFSATNDNTGTKKKATSGKPSPGAK